MAVRKSKVFLIVLAVILGLIGIAYLIGPRPAKPDFNQLAISEFSSDLVALEDSIKKSESSFPVKADNEARIIWSTPYQQTKWSIVYIHGNAASQEEGDPIHEALANRYGCNLFLSRLAEHGLQGDHPMLEITAMDWMQSALDAITIGKAIGEKVLVVSTSTGSTLALYLASRYPELSDGQIMLSPNIDMYDPRSFLLTQPFGLQIARKITGSDFYGWKAPGVARDYWYTSYRIEGLCTLKSIINNTMNDQTFNNVEDPVLMMYYFQDENHQDKVVSVKRMLEMYEQLGTTNEQRRAVAISDAGTHIIGSDIFNQNLESVWIPCIRFCEDILQMTPVNDRSWTAFVDQRAH